MKFYEFTKSKCAILFLQYFFALETCRIEIYSIKSIRTKNCSKGTFKLQSRQIGNTIHALATDITFAIRFNCHTSGQKIVSKKLDEKT